MTRGGKREGSGRPKLESPAKKRTIRLSDDDYMLFMELGGVKWLRLVLKNEKEKL